MLPWFLVWLLLLASAALVLFLSGRMLWRKGKAVLEEVGAAADLLSPAMQRLDAATPDLPAPELAVFADPARLRRDRDRARGRLRDRRARGAGRRPGRSPGRT